MSRDEYDIVVVGGGAAGLVTAAGAAGLGARVALIERERLGGECLWTGCVPSKALLRAARAAFEVRHAARFGVATSEPHVDFARVMRWVRSTQAAIAPHDSPERFRALGVDVVEGTARFARERVLDVDGRRVRGRHVVVATGARPLLPALEGLDRVGYHTTETIFTLEALPAALLVLGGGAVGVELAQAFCRLGTRVTLVETADRVLPNEDSELSTMLTAALRAEGVHIRTATRAARVLHEDGSLALHVTGGDDATDVLRGDALLVTVGRSARLDLVAPAAGGVAVVAEGVVVDDRLRTTARNTWAAGDVVAGAPRFTHVADYHARMVLRNALFPGGSSVDYGSVPAVTFTDPELARVGLTEEAARERHGGVQVLTRSVAALDRTVVDGAPAGLLKVMADRKGRILGAHMLGNEAGTVIAEIALAMKHGIRLPAIASTVHAYPTPSELVRQVADEFNRSRLEGWKAGAVRWLVRRR